MGVAQALSRAVSYALAGGAVWFLSPGHVLALVIFMGQAHFLLAYWYRFESKGVSKASLFSVWVVLAAVLFGVYALQPAYDFWIVFAGMLFVGHFILDELSLLGERKGAVHGTLLFSGAIAVFALELSQFVFTIFFDPMFLAAVVCAVTVVTGWYLYSIRAAIASGFGIYTGLVTVAMVPAIWMVNELHLTTMLGFIILAHYLIWYFDYYIKLSVNRGLRGTYTTRVLLINLLMLGIWLLHKQYQDLPLYPYFFTAVYFYVWTCIHIIFSFIPKQVHLHNALVINRMFPRV